MTSNHMTPRKFLGREIRLAREAKGMKPEELAAAIFVSPSLVRAWESGRRLPRPEDVDKLEEFFGFNGYLRRMRDDLVRNGPAPEWMGRWLEIEEGSSLIHWYQALIIPGLLQTPEYAMEVIERSGRVVEDKDKQVTARIARQAILDNEEDLVLVVVLDEGVLYRPIGGARVMQEQLTLLKEMAGRPNIFVHVVELNTGAYPGLAGGFGIATMEGREFAYVDDAFSGDVLEEPEDVAAMKRVWENIRADVLTAPKSLELIAKAIERWSE